MPPDDLLGQAERRAHVAHLILEQVAQRLDEPKRQIFGQAHVVVRLDTAGGARRVVAGAFDDVGVQRALSEIVDVPELAGFLGKNADELVADNATFLLRVGHPRQPPQERVGRVHVHQAHAQVLLERVDDALWLAPPQQTVVDEDAGELIADCLMHQHRDHSRIHSARKCADHAAATDLRADVRHGLFDERGRRPITSAATDLGQKIAEQLRAEAGVDYLRVELQPDQPVAVPHRRRGRVVTGRGRAEARRQSTHDVAVAHPH